MTSSPSLCRRFLLLAFFVLSSPAFAAPVRKVPYEPIPAPSAAAGANLFLNATVSASGHWSTQTPERAVNGNLDPNDHWACEHLPVWHQVELAEATPLSQIRLWPYWVDGRIYQYKVEGSVDGSTWVMLGDRSGNSIASTAEGDTLNFEPVSVRYVRTTFLGNSRGAANGGHLVEIQGFAKRPDNGLSGGIGTLDARIPPEGSVDDLRPLDPGVEWTAWRGERVNAQAVVFSEGDHSHLRLGASYVSLGATRIPVKLNLIRYTLADGRPQGDILDTADSLPLPRGRNRPIWLQVDVPADVPAGLYRGEAVVQSDEDVLRIPLRLEVLPLTLPDPSEWPFHLDLWQHPEAVARWHDVPAWSDLHLDLMEPSMRRLAEAGQKTITCAIIEEPWNGQTYDHFPSMIQWILRADGSWHYDYTVFDRWVSFMSERCGLADARIHCYSMLPWSLTFQYYDEARGRHVDLALQPGTQAYDDFWGRFLEDFTRHLRSKGWLERTRIAVDERPDAQMRGALATLATHAPELLVASAINHPSDLTRNVDDISPMINHTGSFSPELVAERQAKGMKTTFYVCTVPPRPNTFTFSPPAESEWIPLFAAANGLDGFLRWAYNSWVENPLVSTDFTSWPSGDCFLVYPGDRSSIRFERLRDGIETFEKIRLLRAGPSTPAMRRALEEVDRALARFTWARGAQPGGHTEDVREVNAAVEKASRLR